MIMIDVLIFVLGACIGSFLNVCIIRMPKDLSIVKPGSHCMQCQTPVAWFDNIPLISYWILGGKCRNCKTKFSIRYFLIELLTALTFVAFYQYFGLSIVLLPYLFMTACFLIAFFVDIEHRIIPDQVSVGGMFAGLMFSALIPNLHIVSFANIVPGRMIMRIAIGLYFVATILSLFGTKTKEEQNEKEDWIALAIIIILFVTDIILEQKVLPYLASQNRMTLLAQLSSFDSSIVGALCGGGIIYAMAIIGDVMFKKESMGGGDIKLLAMIGAFLGWQLAILTFFLAPMFGAIFGIAQKIRTGDTTIAYGPFLVLAALLSLFYGDTIIQWILSGYGVF